MRDTRRDARTLTPPWPDAHCSAGASFVPWPCATAVLAYSDYELENEGERRRTND